METNVRSSRAANVWVRVGAGLAVLVALAVMIPAPLAGQDLGIRLGSYLGADADDPVPVVGIFSRLDIPGPLNLEISADYREESLLGGDLEARVIPVRASLVLNFLPVVSPYLLAGVGVDYVGVSFHNEFSDSSDDTGVVLEVHAGGGVEIGLGPFSLVGDLRYCAAGSIGSDAVQGALGHAYDPSGWYASLSAGISF